jgi:hypothetical protein
MQSVYIEALSPYPEIQALKDFYSICYDISVGLNRDQVQLLSYTYQYFYQNTPFGRSDFEEFAVGWGQAYSSKEDLLSIHALFQGRIPDYNETLTYEK